MKHYVFTILCKNCDEIFEVAKSNQKDPYVFCPCCHTKYIVEKNRDDVLNSKGE